MKDSSFILLVVGAILVGIAAFLILRLGGEKEVMQPDQPNAGVDAGLPELRDGQSDNDAAAHVSDEEFLGNTVRYTGTDFIPRKLFMKPDGSGMGCLVMVENKSNEELVFRLGPHNDSGDDPGFAYDPIPPGNSLLIDPRYRIQELTFHNHLKPGPDFVAYLDSTCL